ncbi:putative phospholipid import ATP-binding protein MlaF [Andreprevotia sp. IGB-42]|uniref:ABC transporter ATP-binding protein n=1 Tax=Andreprevotia sp. IGB-42 TaxID=2497473 RepID=UPI001358215E|nr:ABC transporter ATP-binding protein [Andreprevotia sp. IGB-42]KAF0814703.1 putative phospholipid import ATP-binding protein MlaF [Andreprevotia sp. IGB-42]
MPSAAVVELDEVRFAYGESDVLRDVSFKVARGEVVAIMGGSGSGKTTLLKLIGGQLQASAGHVRVDGEDVASLKEAALYRLRSKLGMLFQFGALFTDLSVFENVAFPLRERTALPESVIRDLVLMKLQAVGLRGAAQLMPNELSGGMARRVALARAIALDPLVMLYDEPFTGLDPISLAVTGKLIRELNDALGSASVIVTHDVAESLAIVDRVVFLADGVIVAQGTPDEVRASTHPFVKQFINGEPDGPVPFHRQATPLAAELGLERAHG